MMTEKISAWSKEGWARLSEAERLKRFNKARNILDKTMKRWDKPTAAKKY